MYVYMKECVCVATFSATHHLIVLVLKEEGLRFLLPASNSIFFFFFFLAVSSGFHFSSALRPIFPLLSPKWMSGISVYFM